jgi:hypothetical protein
MGASDRIKNIMDGLYHKMQATVGICTPNLEQLKDSLQKAREHTEYAQRVSSFVRIASGELPYELHRAAEAIGEVNKYVSTSATAVEDLSAACRISEAVAVLNQWARDISEKNGAVPGANERAAAAFDKLFGAVSTFAAKLPPPINQYSSILAQISVAKFFSNMQALGASRVGDDTSTPTGRAMRQVLDEIDSQGR